MADIWEQLRKRYAPPEYALFFEVANGTGATTRRYADAIAASLFPSRGLDFHGFEVKSSRADWLRELKNVMKADAIASYCDFWWIVANDEKVAVKDEVPRNWGLLVSKEGELRQVKQAQRLEPKALDRKFTMALLRRSDEWVKKQLDNDSRLVEAREKGYKDGLAERDWKLKDASEDLHSEKGTWSSHTVTHSNRPHTVQTRCCFMGKVVINSPDHLQRCSQLASPSER